MNLHAIAAGVIGAVNPHTPGLVHISLGSTVGPDFRQIPAYAAPQIALMQIQSLSTKDLQQLDSLNISGSTRAIYLSGNLNGLVRPMGKGGDLVSFGGQVWLVTAVLEGWPDWCKVSVTLQNGA